METETPINLQTEQESLTKIINEVSSQMTREEGEGRCRTLSGKAAYELEKDSNFNHAFILTSEIDNKSHFSDDPNKDLGQKWQYHTYCITKGRSQTFYAFSLGNSNGGSTLKGKTLDEVMAKINETSGPFWPTAEEIESLFVEYDNPNSDASNRLRLYKNYEPVKEIYRYESGNTEATSYITKNPLSI